MDITAPQRAIGKVVGVYCAKGNSFTTQAVDSLTLTYEGITGDHHSGLTRRSGNREPWYARGTEMRNERQLTLLCPAELQAAAEAMGIAAIRPEWICPCCRQARCCFSKAA
jgi:hypothetical protein